MAAFYVRLKDYVAKHDCNVSTMYGMARQANLRGDHSKFKYIDGRPYINVCYEEEQTSEEIIASNLYYELRRYFKNDGELTAELCVYMKRPYQSVYSYLRAFKFKNKKIRDEYVKAFKLLILIKKACAEQASEY